MRLLQGDCLEQLKQLPDHCIDSVVTDPPYGLSKEPDIFEVMRHWINGDDYLHGSRGFCGSTWDSFVPGPRYWKEVYRVLKPGGHVLAFCSTRTWDLLSIALRFAGFQNRDTISHMHSVPALAWNFGSGFPKSHDVSKALTGMGKVEKSKCYEGIGSALKPAFEVILCFRKPLEKGLNLAQNVLRHGCGGLNIDQSRVTLNGLKNPSISRYNSTQQRGNNGWVHANRGANFDKDAESSMNLGRWPANLLLSHSELCEKKGMTSIKSASGSPNIRQKHATSLLGLNGGVESRGYGSTETVEAFECVEGCPVKEIGESARFFKTFHELPDYAPFFYCAKTSKSEKNEGLNSSCTHPTVKPKKLLKYLINLVTPPGGIVLDCFMGSGSTGCAAIEEGFEFIGIEKEEEYFAIAEARINHSLMSRPKPIESEVKKEDAPKEEIETPVQMKMF